MELRSLTPTLIEIIKVLKRFVYLQDPSAYLVLGLFVLQTYCFKYFDTTPFIFLNGPHGSGKTQVLEILNILCYRALLVSSISDAGFYYAINQLRGCLILDEAEYLSMRYQHVIDMAVLNHGYKTGGFVIRVDPGKRKLVKFNCFGPKIFGNITGIYSKPLKSRCIIIKTVPAERKLERFSAIIHGNSLKEMAKAIGLLFKRNKTIDQIKSQYQNFGSIEGLTGRDLELWMGMLVLAKLVDEERLRNTYGRVLQIAIAGIEKKDEETYFLDWNAQFLIALQDSISEAKSDSDSFIQADKITNHVIGKVKPPFNLRTEGLGKILDRESILIERRVRWFRDEAGNQVHKTGWRLDVDRLKRRVSKYTRFLQTQEEFNTEEKERLARDIEKQGWAKLPEDERLSSIGKSVRPKGWDDV